ncbi:MAG TPA: NACHT domain-containing NTPase [Coleofasciculaceae cyanobacterium]
MAWRSLRASTQGIIQAKQAIARKQLTQQILAEQVGLKTRQPIGRFLAGKAIDRRVFMEICFQLDLDWQEIMVSDSAAPELDSKHQPQNFEYHNLDQQALSHYQDKIQAQCGTLQMWAVPQPVEMDDIYVDVKILEQLSNGPWLEISDLLQDFDPTKDDFHHWSFNRIAQKRVLGLEAVAKYSKLMVLGKPGSGKTTFLKFLALACFWEQLPSQRLPVFIWLKYFVENAKEPEGRIFTPLKDYISQEFIRCGYNAKDVEILFEQGKLLILLDGLDEVPESDNKEIIKQLTSLSQTYYKNQFVITSRLASYPYRFPGFTEIEIADFSRQQIETFVQKYFTTTQGTNRQEGLKKASEFITQLGQPENQRIRELSLTPLLLNLACVVFQAKGAFPSQRSKFYEEGIELLLVYWDETKGIKRDAAYQISFAQKIQLLNYLGFITFERGDYFFEQRKIQNDIANYLLGSSRNGKPNPVTLQLMSESILKSIECQDGLLVERSRRIYSFSHLTVQEYFTARYVTTGHLEEALGSVFLQRLVRHIAEKRWRKVFLLVTEMLSCADELLLQMKQHIDQFIAIDEKLQQFLRWVNQKSQSASVECKPAAVRAFFFALALTLEHYFTSAFKVRRSDSPFSPVPYFPLPLYLRLAHNLDSNLNLNRELTLDFKIQTPNTPHSLGLSHIHILDQVIQCALHFDLVLVPESARKLLEAIRSLKAQLPELETNHTWWTENGQAWNEQFAAIITEHRQAGHDWHFSPEQMRHLQQYYQVNKLLVDCLNSDCEVSVAVREQIEETLLLG